MLRNAIIAVAIALGLYAFWDMSKVRPLEPTLSTKWSPVLRPGEVPEPQHNGGLPPWNENEAIFQNARNHVRKSTLEGLDRAWGHARQRPALRELRRATPAPLPPKQPLRRLDQNPPARVRIRCPLTKQIE